MRLQKNAGRRVPTSFAKPSSSTLPRSRAREASNPPTMPGGMSSGLSTRAVGSRRPRQVTGSLLSSARRLVRGVLVDAGPLVAILDRGDAHHQQSAQALESLSGPLVTVWPAFTEAMYLLGHSWRGQKALWSRLETDALKLAALDASDAPRMRELMEKYRDVPMDLADAALVRVAERDDLTRIFTLDRRHFSIYRPGRRRRFAIVP
jgi:uncharacterized protein